MNKFDVGGWYYPHINFYHRAYANSDIFFCLKHNRYLFVSELFIKIKINLNQVVPALWRIPSGILLAIRTFFTVSWPIFVFVSNVRWFIRHLFAVIHFHFFVLQFLSSFRKTTMHVHLFWSIHLTRPFNFLFRNVSLVWLIQANSLHTTSCRSCGKFYPTCFGQSWHD